MNSFSWQLDKIDKEKLEANFQLLKKRYENYHDPWGFNLELIEKSVKLLIPLYRNYFKVKVFGGEHVKEEPYIITSNHTGQIPIDGMLITMAFGVDVHPPRIIRAMVERFLAGLPFLADFTSQNGSILGDRSNCQYLIDKGESILVFPEGVRGISKNTSDFYKLQSFSQGFYRIALQNRTKILPVCVIGAEEMFPFVYNAKFIAKFLKIPSLPLSLNLLPLPSPIDIHIGAPIDIPHDLPIDVPDSELKPHIEQIELKIKEMISQGLRNRRPFLDKIRHPLNRLMGKSS